MLFRKLYGSLLLLAIHQDAHRMRKADMAHKLRLLYRRHGIQHLLVNESTVLHIGIYREIAHSE